MNSYSKKQFSYLIVTIAYWTFMLSDGTLRMLVLLHFHQNGFSPLQLAYLFLFYELAGIFTNLSAGWLATKFGLKLTLHLGLSIQVVSIFFLSLINESWSQSLSIFYVLIIQGVSGVAKDLTKMSSKSAVKLLAPSGEINLFKWVTVLTGSKNIVKGLGFLVGCVLLATLGFKYSLLLIACILFFILIFSIILLRDNFSKINKKVKMFDVFSKDRNINLLSIARVFLFGARDIWFVVGLPIFLYSIFSDGSVESNKKAFFIIGFFMSAWIILYGLVQANSNKFFFNKYFEKSNLVKDSKKWIFYLLINLFFLTLFLFIFKNIDLVKILVFTGLLIYCFIFAINSSLHSYLILRFSQKKRVSLDVGFYYMANSAGRLIGTLLSGLCYQAGGLILSLATATLMIVLCLFFTFLIGETN
ncbi:MAG: organoarsenical effux MFS transporter ArsJ [Alphaproteobacteria bacterium]